MQIHFEEKKVWTKSAGEVCAAKIMVAATQLRFSSQFSKSALSCFKLLSHFGKIHLEKNTVWTKTPNLP